MNDMPCEDWRELHPDSPLLAEIKTALRAAGIADEMVRVMRRRDGYDVSYSIIAGSEAAAVAAKHDRIITLHCGHEKAHHCHLASEIVARFIQS